MFQAGSIKTYFLTLLCNGTEDTKAWELSLHVTKLWMSGPPIC